MKLETVSTAPLARVGLVEMADLRYGYDNKGPHWVASPALQHSYPIREECDPWGPCYTHDVTLVKKLLGECVAAAPLGCVPVTVYVSQVEGLARTNGWSRYDHVYCRDGEVPAWWSGAGLKPWEGTIALAGRRVEMHPAVTRYVVAHEYGHLVDAALAMARWPGDASAFSKLHDEYRRLRRLERVSHYGAGTHHLEVGEVLANDFRTVVLGREPDFWAHPVTPGWKLKTVRRWWERAIDELQALPTGAP